MPRPGPRPYECVRRAWHSERHQPLRGSLIQEIFRVVNEIHSPRTRKNKEWQEKLPIVVLKAEEIMYSKANSEAEYMDLKTLWDRTNDAINTIIRRDESSEKGPFLQPCIEAALHLGCIPRRTSRSQRNNYPGCYLTSSTNPDNNLDYKTSNFMKINHFGAKSDNIVVQNNRDNKFLPIKTNPFLCPNSIFPLYYGEPPQSKEFEFDFTTFAKSNCHPFEHTEMGFDQNVDTPCKEEVNPKNQAENGCDLSLRLGPFVDGDYSNVGAMGKKRKAGSSRPLEDWQILRNPNVPF